MDLKFALLADVISETREGKLNIVGEFNTIFGAQLPITWPHGFTIDSSGGGSHRVFRHESGARAVIPDAGSGTLKPAYVKVVLQAIKEVTKPIHSPTEVAENDPST